MANEEHLAILKQGVEVWNKWRKENPKINPDFSGADLLETNLSSANFSGADLSMGTLVGAVLSRASLSRADLSGTNLSIADLSWANLAMADLTLTNLYGANLSGADLSWANLHMADARLAVFNRTVFFQTILNDIDLSSTKGLEIVIHQGPSAVDINTIYRSKGKIPEAFLLGAGVPDNFIIFQTGKTTAPTRRHSTGCCGI